MKATKRKLAVGKDRQYTLIDEPGNITHNFEEIIKVAARFYTWLYASHVRPGETAESTSSTCDVPRVTKKKVEKLSKP